MLTYALIHLFDCSKDNCIRKETIRRKRGGSIFLFISILCSSTWAHPAQIYMFPKELVIYLIKGEILIMSMELTEAVLHKKAQWKWLFVQQDTAQQEARQGQYPALWHCFWSTPSPANSADWHESVFSGWQFSFKAREFCRLCGLGFGCF